MIFGSDRNAYRQYFFDSWSKYKNQQPLEPLEQQITQLILKHPEYQFIFDAPEKYLETEYFPELGEVNPFYHLALHQSVLDQITLNKPEGILKVYKKLLLKVQNPHEVEHRFMLCLAEFMTQVQQGKLLSEQDYLELLKRLV